MRWPIFYKDDLIVGNLNSPVAICTLWTKKEVVAEKIPKEKYCVIGNLYTAEGINYIIRNILAYPRIKYMVLVGSDMMKTGEALINFIERGIDENYRIIGGFGYIHKKIPKELINVFRQSIKIIDLRSQNPRHLVEKIEDISKETTNKPFTDPVIIEEDEEPIEELDKEDIVFRVEGNTISEVWVKILDIVMKFGEIKQTEYNIKQREVLDVIAVINGREENLPKWLPISEKELKTYCESFFSPEKPEGVDYTYGERLFKYFLSHVPSKTDKEFIAVINQIDHIIKKLKEKPYTRRAIAVTWKHEKDLNSKHPPCLIEIVWSIKNNKLYQTCTFRSHDIYGAWLLNVFALRELQERIAKEVNVDVGSLVVISVSAHIYEKDWKYAKEVVKKVLRGKKIEFELDRRGYFIIRIDKEKKEIVVEHRLKDGRKSSFEFRGKSAEELYRRILNENLVSRPDHAAYLGKELTRAEIALKEGKEYVQDKA